MKRMTKQIKEINCEEAAKRFNDFIDNYLRGRSKEELVHHVEGCRHCFERIEFEKLLKKKISSFSGQKIPNKKSTVKNILSKIYANE